MFKLMILCLFSTSLLATTPYDAPILHCAGATDTSVTLHVCMGSTGAPAGFSVQWMTHDDFVDNNYEWLDPSDPSLCHAFFYRNHCDSTAGYEPSECVDVDVGDLPSQECIFTNCPSPLTLGAKYVFRAFVHGNRTHVRSSFTPTLLCQTIADCTFPVSFWQMHGPNATCGTIPSSCCNQVGHPDLWPVATLLLGQNEYSDTELCQILNDTADSNNGLVLLGKQLIATKLNIANGADPSAIQTAVTNADSIISTFVIPPIGTDFLPVSTTASLTAELASYNDGTTGPGSCP